MTPTRMKRVRRVLRKRPEPKGIARLFLRGLVTLLPVLLTLVVFGIVFQAVDRYVTGPINSVIYWSLEGTSIGWDVLEHFNIDPFDPDYIHAESLANEMQDVFRASEGYSDPEFLNALRRYRHEHLSFFRDLDELGIDRERLRSDVTQVVHPLIGVLLSVLFVLWFGWIVKGFVGRHLVARIDRAMQAIPVVKSVYPYSKQVVEFFFAENKLEFDRVVATPYPSEGLWSIAFVTNDGLRTLREETGEPLVAVFVPSSPMPMTGYTIFVPETKLVPLPLTVDEALRITMTGGVLVPEHEQLDASQILERFTAEGERKDGPGDDDDDGGMQGVKETA